MHTVLFVNRTAASAESKLSSKEVKIRVLKQTLEREVKYSEFHRYFLVANEWGFNKTLRKIQKIKPHVTDKIRVAIIVGESNVLSILPELRRHVDMVIFNDVNEFVCDHIQYQLACLNYSKSKNEFDEVYRKQNLLRKTLKDLYKDKNSPRKAIENMESTWREMRRSVLFDFYSLNEKHFSRRYTDCKKAAKNFPIVYTSFDLFNAAQVSKFSSVLKAHGAIVTLLNLTNLQFYDKGKMLQRTVNMLVPDKKQNPVIMYSVSSHGVAFAAKLISKVTNQRSVYFNLLNETYKALLKPPEPSDLDLVKQGNLTVEKSVPVYENKSQCQFDFPGDLQKNSKNSVLFFRLSRYFNVGNSTFSYSKPSVERFFKMSISLAILIGHKLESPIQKKLLTPFGSFFSDEEKAMRIESNKIQLQVPMPLLSRA